MYTIMRTEERPIYEQAILEDSQELYTNSIQKPKRNFESIVEIDNLMKSQMSQGPKSSIKRSFNEYES